MKAPRRILMFLHAYYLDDTRVRREAEALAAVGWHVEVICLNKGGEPHEELVEGVTVRRANIARSTIKTTATLAREYIRFLIACFKLRKGMMLRREVAVVFVHNMPNFLIFATLPAKLRGVPVILDMHDSVIDVYRDVFQHKSILKRWALEKALIWEERLSTKLATAIMTVNRPIAEDFSQRFGPRDFFLLHNAPDEKALQVSRPIPAKAPSNLVRVLHHGNILSRSGVDRLLPLLRPLNADGERFRLELHGRGDFYPQVKALATNLEVAQYCDFYGPFTHQSIVPFLERASCGVVLPHRNRLFDYALPNKFLEYVACRVPIIAQRLHTLEEYFPADLVQYIETEDDLIASLEALHADPVAAQVRANRAYERLQEISWGTERPKFLEFVRSVTLVHQGML